LTRSATSTTMTTDNAAGIGMEKQAHTNKSQEKRVAQIEDCLAI